MATDEGAPDDSETPRDPAPGPQHPGDSTADDPGRPKDPSLEPPPSGGADQDANAGADELGGSVSKISAEGQDSTVDPNAPTMSDWSPPSLGIRPIPTVPGYVILGEVGRGGMGVVYKAVQVRLNRVVALKMILAGDHASPEVAVRFLAEAEAVARLQHPSIVQVFHIDSHEGRLYIEMEFVEGPTLASQLDANPRPPRQAAELIVPLARAMAMAHGRGVIHRDLKPANVLITPEGVPKITDFGVAKALGVDSGLTETDLIMGSPSYMAPEQAGGRAREAGPAADVYSLGAILYELLTGRPPFKAASMMDTLELVKQADPVPPSRLVPGLPRDLETICLKCLEKPPEERYRTAHEMAEDLGRFLAGESILARAAGPGERIIKWVRRRPTTAGLLALGAAVLLGILVLGTWTYERLHANHAAHLIRTLETADLADVRPILRELDDYRVWADPLLVEAARQAPPTSRRRLRLALALRPIDPQQVDYLADRLLTADPEELELIRDTLDRDGPALVPRLHAVLASRGSDPGRRFRAACALAGLAPGDPLWGTLAPEVAARLVAENPLLLGRWANVLQPVRAALVGPLAALARDPRRLDAERLAAVSLVIDFAGEATDLLADLVPDANSRQFEALLTRLRRDPDRAAAWLARVLNPPGADPPPTARRARAAAALIRLSRAAAVWPAFRQATDPQLRTALIHDLAQFGVDPAVLARRLAVEPEVSARRALVLALGQYAGPPGSPAERTALVNWLIRADRDDPDPGLHAAADWLLRRWGQATAVGAIDRALARRDPDPESPRRWYVNRMGMTLAVVRGPVEFEAGSPPGERGRGDDEPQRRVRIGRDFAVATREVTVAEFRRFLHDHPEVFQVVSSRYSPEPRCPMTYVSWFSAAAFCRWLSEQEGIEPDQMCYPPVAEIKEGMRLGPESLTRTGYRLPTEAEWEFVCRAGSTASRPFGDDDAMLGKYAWYLKNADDQTWPVGQLEPNDLGFFDILGNIKEWCQAATPFPGDAPKGAALEDREAGRDVTNSTPFPIRGGMFSTRASDLRSAARDAGSAISNSYYLGFRIARTLPHTPAGR